MERVLKEEGDTVVQYKKCSAKAKFSMVMKCSIDEDKTEVCSGPGDLPWNGWGESNTCN